MPDSRRVVVLDVLRGFAILGIPLMNIQSFAMISQAYLNPTVYGDLTGLNLGIWLFSHVVADHKFMTIFSLLFGASTLMIVGNLESRGLRPWPAHYRRNFWLLIIGLSHAYLVWYGDILAPYAVTAWLVYPLRKMKVPHLAALGLIFFSVSSISDLVSGLSLLQAPAETVKAMQGAWNPTDAQIERELLAYQGDFRSQLTQRMQTTIFMQTQYFPGHYLWRILGLMLLGMAMFKSGFITGQLETAFYQKVLLLGGVLGLSLVVTGLIFNFHHQWKLQYAMLLGSQFNYWGSLGMAMAYMSAVVLICRQGLFPAITSKLASVGRMALSNYLLQSFFFATLFYGFGWFGRLDRIHQFLLVVMVWLVQPLVSDWWLRHFQYGPFEWVWRSLTQGKIVKIRW